jgi:hypothetical protein
MTLTNEEPQTRQPTGDLRYRLLLGVEVTLTRLGQLTDW